MPIQQNLRALLDLVDDLQNGQLELRSKLDDEQFNNLVRQAHNLQSGVLGEPVDNLLKRALLTHFKAAMVEVEGKRREESMELIEALINNIKIHAGKRQIDLEEIVPLGGLAGEGIRLLSMIVTSIFGNNRRQLEKIAAAIQKASARVTAELDGHFLLLDNLQLIDRDYTGELKFLEVQLSNIETTLFHVSEALISLFRRIVPDDFDIDETKDLNRRINQVVIFAENQILNNQDRLRFIEADFENFLFFVGANVTGAKSLLINAWNDFSKKKTNFHEACFGEIEQFNSTDESRKKSFLDDVQPQSQEVLRNLGIQIENLNDDLSRKAALIAF